MTPELKNDLNNLARLAMIGCAGQAEPVEALYAAALACKRVETALTPPADEPPSATETISTTP